MGRKSVRLCARERTEAHGGWLGTTRAAHSSRTAHPRRRPQTSPSGTAGRAQHRPAVGTKNSSCALAPRISARAPPGWRRRPRACRRVQRHLGVERLVGHLRARVVPLSLGGGAGDRSFDRRAPAASRPGGYRDRELRRRGARPPLHDKVVRRRRARLRPPHRRSTSATPSSAAGAGPPAGTVSAARAGRPRTRRCRRLVSLHEGRPRSRRVRRRPRGTTRTGSAAAHAPLDEPDRARPGRRSAAAARRRAGAARARGQWRASCPTATPRRTRRAPARAAAVELALSNLWITLVEEDEAVGGRRGGKVGGDGLELAVRARALVERRRGGRPYR